MSSLRNHRVGDLILKELSVFSQTQLKDERIGFLTFSHIDLAKDLSQASVFVSVFGTEKEEVSTLIALNNSAGYLRRHLSKVLHTRTVPKLTFVIDHSLEHSEKINRLLDDI